MEEAKLILWDEMKAAVMNCHSVDEVALIRNQAEAYRYALKQAKESPEVIRKAEEIKLRAERRAGELLNETPKNKGGNPNLSKPTTGSFTLENLGVTRDQSSKWQKIASIPEDKFETYISVQKELSTSGALRLSRVTEREKEIDDIEIKEMPNNIDLRLGDFRDVMQSLPDNSVDLIFTDPPYDEETIPLYGNLAELSKRVLKSGGSLIVYAGHYALPKYFELMSPHLRYWWEFSLRHQGGASARLIGKNVFVGWKPLLWFVKEYRGGKEFVNDSYEKPQGDKDFHKWQQTVYEADYYITKLTEIGDTVLDPFTGSGTTLIAAHNKGRNAIGIELDEETMIRAKKRISEFLSKSHKL